MVVKAEVLYTLTPLHSIVLRNCFGLGFFLVSLQFFLDLLVSNKLRGAKCLCAIAAGFSRLNVLLVD